MKKLKHKIVVLGAGLSGLTTAYELSKVYKNEVIVLERDSQVGGLCKTISANNVFYDLGSHRIHWNSKEEVLNFIKCVSSKELIKKIRGGKLRIKRSYIEYPLVSAQMFFGLGFIESFLCAVSLLAERVFKKKSKESDCNYESYLIQKTGRRAYRLFYEPYARKVWGCDPSLISITAVKKRVSMVKPISFLQEIITNRLVKSEKKFYYYFEDGIGSIASELEKCIVANGGRVVKNVRDFSLKTDQGRREIVFYNAEEETSVEFDKLVSTIAIDELVLKLHHNDIVDQAASRMKWRGLRLVYLHFDSEPKLTGETFYFPETKYLFGRVSFPKRFSAKMQSSSDKISAICEVPCSEGDGVWNMPDKEIYDRCFQGLQEVGLVSKEEDYFSEKNFIISIPKIYSVYLLGWRSDLTYILQYLADNFPHIYVSGKPGFFMHCNLDHAIDMGLCLAEYVKKDKAPRDWYQNIDIFHNMKLRD